VTCRPWSAAPPCPVMPPTQSSTDHPAHPSRRRSHPSWWTARARTISAGYAPPRARRSRHRRRRCCQGQARMEAKPSVVATAEVNRGAAVQTSVTGGAQPGDGARRDRAPGQAARVTRSAGAGDGERGPVQTFSERFSNSQRREEAGAGTFPPSRGNSAAPSRRVI